MIMAQSREILPEGETNVNLPQNSQLRETAVSGWTIIFNLQHNLSILMKLTLFPSRLGL